jgi:hypothetical protein
MASLVLPNTCVLAQTDGTAKLEATIANYSVDGPAHWTVAWVTTESGAFIKTLRKQGTKYAWTSSQWQTHCTTWNNARGGTAGSTIVDGYTSATATTYTGTNSPVILTWNCRDASNNLMPDGNYRLWVQYVEDTGSEGPYTTGGLLWTKGPVGTNNTYANQGANFTNLKVTWTPAVSAVAPTITSATPPATGIVGVPYNHTCTATGTAPIRFTATGLPTGLAISSAGVLSGIPVAAGTFPGTITATNGTLPNATQAFSIVIGVVPATFGSIELSGPNLVMSGYGPANGTYTLLGSTNLGRTLAQWTPIATNTFDGAGAFRLTNAIGSGAASGFFRLKVP